MGAERAQILSLPGRLHSFTMNLLSLLACVSLALVSTAAQKPVPCVVPPLLNGQYAMSLSNGVMGQGAISYDAFGKRFRVKSMGMAGNETFAVDQLMLFNKKVYYEVDWSKFSCKKKPLDATFNPMQVPEDAQLMGQVVIGSSSSWGMGVLVNTWYGSLPQNGQYMAVYTDKGCIPTSIMSFSPATGWNTISTFNWVLGNTNPMDFHPPAICNQAQLEETEEPDTFFAAMSRLSEQTKREL